MSPELLPIQMVEPRSHWLLIAAPWFSVMALLVAIAFALDARWQAQMDSAFLAGMKAGNAMCGRPQ